MGVGVACSLTLAEEMKRVYLGDSYDCVKRLWHQLLEQWAPLRADPRFIPDDLAVDFTTMTGIPVGFDNRSDPFSILNDPDTGIRLPGEDNQAEGRTHVTIARIIDQLTEDAVHAVVTFDQSDYRQMDLDRRGQRMAKLEALQDAQKIGFYYVSHAPFLFAFTKEASMAQCQNLLLQAGIPANRIEIG